VRGVLRRAQGPYHRAVRSPVCGAADQDEKSRTTCPVCRADIRETIKVFCS
jgi:hypothetical protein